MSLTTTLVRGFARAGRPARTQTRRWCASRGATPLPASPVELAAYLAERAESASIATVRMARAAVAFVHKAKGEPSPITDDVLEVLRDLAASKAAEPGRGQARAITRDDFAVLLARAGEPRKIGRHMETAETAAERAQVDRAIAGVLFHAGLRRSEAAELRWGDVEPAASMPGALTIRVRTSKTNRDGETTDIRLVKNGAGEALTALRPENASPTALVFRGLNGQSIGRRFAAVAKAAGVEGVTAHSGRVGRRRSQHHRDHACRWLEDVAYGCSLQRRRISRARRGREMFVIGISVLQR